MSEDRHSTVRFVLPVMLENVSISGLALIFSAISGTISASSLTTIAQGNQIVNMLNSAASMFITGAAILCSRLLGAGERREASHELGQTLFLSAVYALIVTLIGFIFAGGIMRLFMPGTQGEVLEEGIVFFRILILTFPFLVFHNVVTSAIRAGGNSRDAMYISALTNILLVIFGYLFIIKLKMGALGAGLAYVACRVLGCIFAFFMLIIRRTYSMTLKDLFTPDIEAFKRILRLGVPTTIESFFVQVGYTVANSMVIGLGTFEAAVFTVANTLYNFAAIVQSISTPVAMTLVGNRIGAKNYKGARKLGIRIFAVGMTCSCAVAGLIWIFGTRLTPIYSSDPGVQARAASALSAVFFMCIPAITLNSLDPQLRVGGDVRFVMVSTLIAVWLVRLPLTYLFCYKLNWGAFGVFWANTIALTCRAIPNSIRYITGKYLYMRV